MSKATEILQEGLRLPPVRLFRKGEMNEDLLNLVDTGDFAQIQNVSPRPRLGEPSAAIHRLLDRFGDCGHFVVRIRMLVLCRTQGMPSDGKTPQEQRARWAYRLQRAA